MGDRKKSDGQSSESWWFEFQAQPSDVPENVRYRHLLKFALRSLGLRCRRVSGVGPDAAIIDRENATEDRRCQ